MLLSIEGLTRQKLLTGVCLALVVLGCDHSPTELRSDNGLTVPDHVVFGTATGSAVAASAISTTEIDLAWQKVSSPQVTGFEIARSTDGPTGSYSSVARVAASATRYADVGLTQSTNYCYEIRSYKTAGRNTNYSAYSAPACATTKIGPPTETDATSQGSTSAVVTWKWGPGSATGFRVERSATNTGPWEVAATTSSASAKSYVDTGRESDKPVCYRIIALNSEGESAPSNVDCTTPLAAPTDLVAVSVSDGIQLSWKDNSNAEFGFIVQAATDGVNFYRVADLPANTMSFHHAGVTSGISYWYRVAARREDLSDFSNIATAASGCVPAGEEVCGNDLDDDCNGLVDDNDPACGQLTDCNANPCGSGTICNGMWCVSSCTDGYTDSDESDVDCGGGCGSTCQVGRLCWGNWDCVSNNCVYQPGAFKGVCQSPAPGQP